MLKKLLAILIIIVVAFAGAQALPPLGHEILAGSAKSSGKVVLIIDNSFFQELYSRIGYEYKGVPFVEWAFLVLPSAGMVDPVRIEAVSNGLRAEFSSALIEDYTSRHSRSNVLTMPTINLLVLDYYNNLSIHLFISSYTVASLKGMKLTPYQVATQKRDLLLTEGQIRLDDRSIDILLQTDSLIVRKMPNIPDIYEILNMTPPTVSPTSLVRLTDGIYYNVDYRVIQNMGTTAPDWWSAHFIEADGDSQTNATYYWNKLVTFFYASTYYVDLSKYNDNIMQGLQALTYSLLHENLQNITRGPAIIPVASEALDGFVGMDQWNNSLTGTAGWVDIGDAAKHLRTRLAQFSVEPSPYYLDNDRKVVRFEINSNWIQGFTSKNGLMIFGYYVSGLPVVNYDTGSISPVAFYANSQNTTKYIYVNLSSLTYGPDYLFVWWKIIDINNSSPVCDGYCMKVRPVTLITPLFEVTINVSTIMVSDDPNLSNWEFPAAAYSSSYYYSLNFRYVDNPPKTLYRISTDMLYSNVSYMYDAVLDLPLPASIALAMIGFIPNIPYSYAVILNMLSILSSIGVQSITANTGYLFIQYHVTQEDNATTEYIMHIGEKYTRSADYFYGNSQPLGVLPNKIIIYINKAS